MVRCLLCRSFDCSIEVGQGDIIRISPNEVSSRVHMFMSRLGNWDSLPRFITAPLCKADGVQRNLQSPEQMGQGL